VYEPSTGNTGVMGLAWNLVNMTLHAATEGEFKDWLGRYHLYRKFNQKLIDGFDINLPILRGKRILFWPNRAVYIESAFGYAYDAAGQVLLECFDLSLDLQIS
jgi:hypothetical protein